MGMLCMHNDIFLTNITGYDYWLAKMTRNFPYNYAAAVDKIWTEIERRRCTANSELSWVMQLLLDKFTEPLVSVPLNIIC